MVILGCLFALLAPYGKPRIFYFFLVAAAAGVCVSLSVYLWKLGECYQFVYSQVFGDNTQTPFYVQNFNRSIGIVGATGLFFVIFVVLRIWFPPSKRQA